MRAIHLMAAVLLTGSWVRAAEPADDEGVSDAVVKIFTTAQKPDFYQPWQMNPLESFTGSGAVIEGGRILTNAHVVSGAVHVQVRRSGGDRKYDAVVEFVGHDCDLATIKVTDPAFLKGITPLRLGELPRQRDKVSIFGYPTGGDDLSITEGSVSRIEVVSYAHSGWKLLALQTDAAINPGNSGGPMVKGGKIVGISMQSFSGSGVENTGYAVPAPIIRRFLADLADGRYDEAPTTGFATQQLENPRMREYYGMTAEQTGVVINEIYYESTGWGSLKLGDVLLSIGGVRIANDGTYLFDKGKRLSLMHLITLHQVGDVVPFEVLRDSRTLRVPVTMKARDLELVRSLYDAKPSYFIYGGLVFTAMTKNLLETFNQNDLSSGWRYLQDFGRPSLSRPEVVLLSFVLPHEVNEGYQDLRGAMVDSVNGRPLSSLKDLVEAFRHPVDGSQIVVFDPVTDGGRFILDAAKAAAAGPEILAKHGIPGDRSEDLRAVP